MRDDILPENEVVIKALQRLPQDLLDERNFRLIRAMQLNCQKIVLPKEQWVKFEEVRHTFSSQENVEKRATILKRVISFLAFRTLDI